MYEDRAYRNFVNASNLMNYNVIEKETDLQIYTRINLSKKALAIVSKYRSVLEDYIFRDQDFYYSLTPIRVETSEAEIVKHMAEVACKVGVGPMAAVAGAIAEDVGKELLELTEEVIIENGGDIFIKTNITRKILVYAGESIFSNKLALEIEPKDTPLGICTSAGTVGHSLSFGKADAVVVISKDTALADASATAIGNIVKTVKDIQKGLERAQQIKGVEGALIIIGDKMGAWGKIKLVKP